MTARSNRNSPDEPQADKNTTIGQAKDLSRESDGDTSDPFDPARYRIAQNPADALSVKKVITTIPCRKPNRHEWVRVRQGDDWRLETFVFEDKVQRETFLVDPQVISELGEELNSVCLYLAVTRDNNPFLWQVKLPGPDGRDNPWNASARDAAKLAESQWIRMSANQRAGYYDVLEPTNIRLPDPQWPDLSFRDLLQICFKDHLIDGSDHIIVKQLRGAV